MGARCNPSGSYAVSLRIPKEGQLHSSSGLVAFSLKESAARNARQEAFHTTPTVLDRAAAFYRSIISRRIVSAL
jgi:hypothetical protein